MSNLRRLFLGSLVLVSLISFGSRHLGAQPPKNIQLTPLGVYETLRFDEGAVEISAFDPSTRRAFLTFASEPKVEVVDVSDPAKPFLAAIIDLTRRRYGGCLRCVHGQVRAGHRRVVGRNRWQPGRQSRCRKKRCLSYRCGRGRARSASGRTKAESC